MNLQMWEYCQTTADIYQTESSLNVLLFTVLEDALSGRGGYALPRVEAALPHTPHVPHAPHAEAATARCRRTPPHAALPHTPQAPHAEAAAARRTLPRARGWGWDKHKGGTELSL